MRNSLLACLNRRTERRCPTGNYGNRTDVTYRRCVTILRLNATTDTLSAILLFMNESVTLARDVEGAMIPVGTKVTLQKGEQAYITQSLGGSYTVVVNGNMFRIE